MADDKAVTFTGHGSVNVLSEDGEESQVFQAGVPVTDVPSGVLKRIADAEKHTVDGYSFEVGSPKTAEKKFGAPQSAGD